MKKVICIDDSWGSSDKTLIAGEVYTIIQEYHREDGEEMYELESGGRFKAKRFKPVPPTSFTTTITWTSADEEDSDPEETRLRKRYNAPRVGNCKCGLPKSQCVYHRDT